MRFVSYLSHGRQGIAVKAGNDWRGRSTSEAEYPGSLEALIKSGGNQLAEAGEKLMSAPVLKTAEIQFLPPLANPEKVICVGLNYRDHSAESGFKQPDFPTLFGRFNSSLIGHGAPLLRPPQSEQFDYEGELVAIIGKSARDVSETDALDHVMGYSIFNDGSLRDYQFKAPQWTPGKNFDDTGAFGPWLVTADELPSGCKGLKLQTRLNGQVVQSASTSDMVFPVANLVAIISSFLTLKPGDLIVTGTPSGVGMARKPQLWMKHGDTCEIEIENIGVLSNPVLDRK